MQKYVARTGTVQRLSILGRALRQEAEAVDSRVESKAVPKMLVVFLEDSAATIAEAAAAGGRSVRFMEVDIRAAAATTTRHKPFDAHTLGEYAGLVVAASPDTEISSLEALVRRVRGHASENLVLGGCGADGLDRALTAAGGIVVSPRRSDPAEVGARVAKVAGWVRHSLGHEAEEHPHPHHHEHTA